MRFRNIFNRTYRKNTNKDAASGNEKYAIQQAMKVKKYTDKISAPSNDFFKFVSARCIKTKTGGDQLSYRI